MRAHRRVNERRITCPIRRLDRDVVLDHGHSGLRGVSGGERNTCRNRQGHEITARDVGAGIFLFLIVGHGGSLKFALVYFEPTSNFALRGSASAAMET